MQRSWIYIAHVGQSLRYTYREISNETRNCWKITGSKTMFLNHNTRTPSPIQTWIRNLAVRDRRHYVSEMDRFWWAVRLQSLSWGGEGSGACLDSTHIHCKHSWRRVRITISTRRMFCGNWFLNSETGFAENRAVYGTGRRGHVTYDIFIQRLFVKRTSLRAAQS
jgi:hypothetical protein